MFLIWKSDINGEKLNELVNKNKQNVTRDKRRNRKWILWNSSEVENAVASVVFMCNFRPSINHRYLDFICSHSGINHLPYLIYISYSFLKTTKMVLFRVFISYIFRSWRIFIWFVIAYSRRLIFCNHFMTWDWNERYNVRLVLLISYAI